MMAWEKRPTEIANLLNPAYCGEIVCQAAKEYQQIAKKGLPFSLTFLVLPLILYPESRNLISVHTRLQLHSWIEGHQNIRVGFASRAKFLVPVTREAMMFILQTRAASLDASGRLAVSTRKKGYGSHKPTKEVKEIHLKSRIVGRWFARAGPAPNVFSLLGVKP